MGCILSIFPSTEKIECNTQLLIHYKCFVCDKTFISNNEYNKHIPNCKMG